MLDLVKKKVNFKTKEGVEKTIWNIYLKTDNDVLIAIKPAINKDMNGKPLTRDYYRLVDLAKEIKDVK